MSFRSASAHGNIVTVNYVYAGAQSHRVDYMMVEEGSSWKIDDIIYFDQGKAESYRAIMRRLMAR